MDEHRKRIYLMRHGEVSYFDEQGKPKNPREIELTENGVAQAGAAASALEDINFDRVLTSGLKRAGRTAEIVVGDRQIEIKDDNRLEEIHGGRLREVDDAQLRSNLAYPFEDTEKSDARFLNGESYEDFESRVLDGWNSFVLSSGWKSALVVAHEGVNRILLSWAAGSNRRLMSAFQQDMACINIVDIDVDTDKADIKRVTIKLLNHTPYNSNKKDMMLSNMEQVYQTYSSAQRNKKT